MDRPHILTLRRVKYMVIDEADEMLHPDWEDDFGKILSGGGKSPLPVVHYTSPNKFP
jgi:ATP-dependent RNA helicase DDX3X